LPDRNQPSCYILIQRLLYLIRIFISDAHQSMQNETVELSIVMPCLNEEKSLADCLQKAFSFLADNKLKGEVIVVDNGSSDNSPLIAQQFNSILVTEHEK